MTAKAPDAEVALTSAEGGTRALLCAALLAHDGPLGTRELMTLLGVSADAVQRQIHNLQQTLAQADLGIQIDHVAGGYRLVVQPALLPALSAIMAPPPLPPISQASLETLALVAYHQPVTRGELEAARGASCSSTLETLQERDLVRVIGQREVVGRPLLYGTTAKFLIEFGLASLDDLPPVEDGDTSNFLRG